MPDIDSKLGSSTQMPWPASPRPCTRSSTYQPTSTPPTHSTTTVLVHRHIVDTDLSRDHLPEVPTIGHGHDCRHLLVTERSQNLKADCAVSGSVPELGVVAAFGQSDNGADIHASLHLWYFCVVGDVLHRVGRGEASCGGPDNRWAGRFRSGVHTPP